MKMTENPHIKSNDSKHYYILNDKGENLFNVAICFKDDYTKISFGVKRNQNYLRDSITDFLGTKEYMMLRPLYWQGTGCGDAVTERNIDKDIDITTIMKDVVTLAVEMEIYNEHVLIEREEIERQKELKKRKREEMLSNKIKKLDNIFKIINTVA